ncbi:MAG TPA: hypothetical protein VIK72_10620 [Clostridiaceae bacterium]
MHIIFLTRKRFGVITIILGLMILTLALGYNFNDGLKFTSLMQNDIYSLKEYESKDQNLSYKLPSDWKTSARDMKIDNIKYYNEFVSKDSSISGSVAVIQNPEAIGAYVEFVKNLENSNNPIEKVTKVEKKLQTKIGYLLRYEARDLDLKVYDYYQYYIKNKDSIYTFQFSVRKDKNKANMLSTFDTIFKTVTLK